MRTEGVRFNEVSSWLAAQKERESVYDTVMGRGRRLIDPADGNRSVFAYYEGQLVHDRKGKPIEVLARVVGEPESWVLQTYRTAEDYNKVFLPEVDLGRPVPSELIAISAADAELVERM